MLHRCAAILLGSLLSIAMVLPAQQPQVEIKFTDVTRAAGITFTHTNGATGQKYLPETMGAGVAFLDYNGDGWQDIFFVNSRNWVGGRRTPPALYRNDGDGTFTDVTREVGLDVWFYGLGVAVADYDNDGDIDLFITTLERNHLFRNNGVGKFEDVSKAAGFGDAIAFSTSAAWVDYDQDGWLDLFVANYVQWSGDNDIHCTLDGTNKSYCTPESYRGTSPRLWRNQGRGQGANEGANNGAVQFEDVTEAAGITVENAKSLGVAVFDYDRDGWPDIFLANDTEPNNLFRNLGGGREDGGDVTFEERGMMSGVAYSEDGVARAGMGVDAADYDRSGYPSLLISNFSNQMLSLYDNKRGRLFVDAAPASGIGRASLLTLGFSCFFWDYDLDGWLDIYVANGHIENEIEKIQRRVTHAQPPHLFRNQGDGKFIETTESAGEAFAAARVARGAAYADIDNDGDLDLVLTTNGGAPKLFRNESTGNRSVRIKLLGSQSNRNGIGARVTVTARGGSQTQTLRSGSGYLSQSELVLTFGLGKVGKADRIEVEWPSGATDRLENVAAGQTIVVSEGKGQTSARPYAAKE